MKVRVAVALSGGVDSSVAAALLVQQNFDVIGLTMKLHHQLRTDGSSESPRGCCSLDSIYRAQAVCHLLNIPHYTIDLTSEFNQYVIEDFISEYVSGRTPNPCIRCNTYLKWGVLFDKAQRLECSKLATGHYAITENRNGETHLLRAADRSKDQAYALWGIPRSRLQDTLLPLGKSTKAEVRSMAAQLGLITAATPESQEICFIPDDDYPQFLIKERPDLFQSIPAGEICDEVNYKLIKVGEHSGYPFYTVGQRRGLGGGFPDPRYVLRVEPENNRVVIGPKARLVEWRFLVDQVNWVIEAPNAPVNADIQVRYHSQAVPGTITILDERCLVELTEGVEAIAPGQSAVFFEGERLIGGGRIVKVLYRDNLIEVFPEHLFQG